MVAGTTRASLDEASLQQAIGQAQADVQANLAPCGSTTSQTRQELGAGIKGAFERGSVAFSEDGRRVVVVYRSGTAITMPVSVSAWKLRACAIAGRALTPDEWRAAIPGRPYAPACSPRRR